MPLPPGLALNRHTGQITGVPTTPGVYGYTLRVRDAQGSLRDIPVEHTIHPYDPPVLGGAPGALATRGVAYSASFSVVDGVGPYTWSVASGQLPTGLGLDPATGLLSGTPTQSDGFTDRALTVRVTDTPGSSDQLSFTLKYRDALATGFTYPPATRDRAYSQTPTLVGGHAPFAWAIVAGAMPPGLAFSPTTGRVSGTPTTIQSDALTVRVTDAAGNTADIAQTFSVMEHYDPVVLTGGMTGTEKSYQRASGTEAIAPVSTLEASGGNAAISYSWARLSGSAQLSAAAPTAKNTGFNSSAGPGESVSAEFELTASDGISSATYRVTITAHNTYVTLALGGTPAAVATRGVAYSSGFTRSGGAAPYTWTLVAGALPAGLTLHAGTGVISGTPTQTSGYGDRALTVRVSDALSQSAQASYTLTYRDALAISGVPGPAYTGQPYSFTPTLSGGVGPYTVTLAAGSLPAGLSLHPTTGAITGTAPGAQGTTSFTLRVTDALGDTATLATAVTVWAYTPPTLTGSVLGTATRTKAYSASLTRAGGVAPYTFSLASGSLPPGLTLNTGTGALSGTPAATSYADYTFTLRVTDALGKTADSAPQTIAYRDLPTFTGGALTRRVRGEAISHTFTATASAHTPVTWSIVAGALPAGASLNGFTGAVSGTLTSTVYGTHSFTVRATDAVGNTVDAACTLAYADVVAINLGEIPLSGAVGVAYSGTALSAGGFPPRAYSIVGGALPAGVTLNASTGAVSGTPSAAYDGSVTIRVTDADGRFLQDTRAIFVYGALTVTSQWGGGALNPGQALNVTGLATSNGVPPVSYAVASGALPGGISLNASSGALTGTVTGSGAYSFVLRATDGAGRTASTTTISGSVGSTLSASASPNPAQGSIVLPEPAPPSEAVSTGTTITASGGSGSYSYSWARLSGDVIDHAPSGSPVGKSCGFIATVLKNSSKTATFRCTVSDGSATTTVDVFVSLDYQTDQ